MNGDPPPAHRSLVFELDVVDDWPPVAVECLPFQAVAGGLELQAVPLFVKGLALRDVITVRTKGDRVTSWKHRRMSGYSTMWLLEIGRGAKRMVGGALVALRALGCVTSSAEKLVVHAVGVPPEVAMVQVDAVTAALDATKVAIAYPALRHG